MSALSERKLAEFAQWYSYNKSFTMDPARFVEFSSRAIDCLAEIVAIQAADIQRLERRPGNPEVRKILVPTGVNLHSRMHA